MDFDSVLIITYISAMPTENAEAAVSKTATLAKEADVPPKVIDPCSSQGDISSEQSNQGSEELEEYLTRKNQIKEKNKIKEFGKRFGYESSESFICVPVVKVNAYLKNVDSKVCKSFDYKNGRVVCVKEEKKICLENEKEGKNAKEKKVHTSRKRAGGKKNVIRF